uniref:Sep-tRNA:Sec-tRNA synthase n=1 Tax=Emiliania huxleyi TaxID=2903 RepID=A0A7S3SQ15_EMIHU
MAAPPRAAARLLPGLSAQARGGGGQARREGAAHAKQRHLDVGDAHAAGGVQARRLARRGSLFVRRGSPASSRRPTRGSVPLSGASLFVRLVSGLRVVTPSAAGKTVGGIPFESYGAHYSGYPCAYFSVACAIGIADGDVDLFLRRLDKALAEWKKPPRQPKAKAGGADGAAGNGSCAAKDRDLAKDFRPNPSAKEFVPAAQPAPCMTAAPPCSAEKAEEKGVAAE